MEKIFGELDVVAAGEDAIDEKTQTITPDEAKSVTKRVQISHVEHKPSL
jgi:hypothetical protein